MFNTNQNFIPYRVFPERVYLGSRTAPEYIFRSGTKIWPNRSTNMPPPPGRYSLYSDDRDDRRNFLGVVIGDLVFLGVVQEKSFKKIKLVFVRV